MARPSNDQAVVCRYCKEALPGWSELAQHVARFHRREWRIDTRGQGNLRFVTTEPPRHWYE